MLIVTHQAPLPESRRRRKGRRSGGEAARKNFGGGSENEGRSGEVEEATRRREVESLIALATGPCGGKECGAGEAAFTLDLRG